MPTLATITQLELDLQALNAALAEAFSAEVVLLCTPITPGLDYQVMEEIEALSQAGTGTGTGKLVVVLDTTGGYINPVERIVTVLRHHYETVEFVIPNQAFSAGTILVMSGDKIYMDYHSVLGPIDPQMLMDDIWVSGFGYLAKYQECKKAVVEAADAATKEVETMYLIQRFDPAVLFEIESSIKQGQKLLETWLSQYKFKDWIDKSTGLPVSDKKKRARAGRIARRLGDRRQWLAHDRGINLQELRDPNINLKIEDLGDDPNTLKLTRSYYTTMIDIMDHLQIQGAMHTRNNLRRLS